MKTMILALTLLSALSARANDCVLLVPSDIQSALNKNADSFQVSKTARTQEQAALQQLAVAAESKGYRLVEFLGVFDEAGKNGVISLMPPAYKDDVYYQNAIRKTGKDLNSLMVGANPILTFGRSPEEQYEKDNYTAAVRLTTSSSCKEIRYGAAAGKNDGRPDRIDCKVQATNVVKLGTMTGKTWYTKRPLCLDINVGFGSSGRCSEEHGKHTFESSETAAADLVAKLPVCK